MYSSAHSSHQQYRAYANAAMTVSKLRQVVMLYDGSIRFVQQAIEAINEKDYALRYNLLSRTTDIIAGLQTSLDYENGGNIAKLLYDYYASLDARIFSVHRSNDTAVLEGVIKDLKQMRDTWNAIDESENAKRASVPLPATPVGVAAPAGAAAGLSGLGVSA